VGDWIERWIVLLERQPADGNERKRGLVSPRTSERYAELLRHHVVPELGRRPLQQVQATEIDALYLALERVVSVATVKHLHVALGACFRAAVKKGILLSNPVERADRPRPEEPDHGQVLDAQQLKVLVEKFRSTPLFEIVATAAGTGARRGEILALRWDDFDFEKKTLRIERAIEETKKYGRVTKEPKSARGRRIISIDDGLIALLRRLRERHLRLLAGIPDGMDVDLSLIKLPDGALIFPSPLRLTQLRDPHAVGARFIQHAAKVGFEGLKLHDLRRSHATMLLDRGLPLHVVAERLGHSPAVLLKAYAKRTKNSDRAAADIIGELWVQVGSK
jgi:integrase